MDSAKINCPMRREDGICLPRGNPCLVVSNGICRSLRNAYRDGVASVEVVRCKDCRHYYPDTLSCRNLICCSNWYPEDFCSYGEREDNEN